MSQKATTTSVAQAISFAVDEVQEHGTSGGDAALWINPGDEGSVLRVTEVGAELYNFTSREASQFTIKTSDGQEWNVRITPKEKA